MSLKGCAPAPSSSSLVLLSVSSFEPSVSRNFMASFHWSSVCRQASALRSKPDKSTLEFGIIWDLTDSACLAFHWSAAWTAGINMSLGLAELLLQSALCSPNNLQTC